MTWRLTWRQDYLLRSNVIKPCRESRVKSQLKLKLILNAKTQDTSHSDNHNHSIEGSHRGRRRQLKIWRSILMTIIIHCILWYSEFWLLNLSQIALCIMQLVLFAPFVNLNLVLINRRERCWCWCWWFQRTFQREQKVFSYRYLKHWDHNRFVKSRHQTEDIRLEHWSTQSSKYQPLEWCIMSWMSTPSKNVTASKGTKSELAEGQSQNPAPILIPISETWHWTK